MRLRHAILATAAETSSDGKVSMVGGDFNRITVPAFPAIHPQMSVVVKLWALPHECNQPHPVSVEVIAPGGTQVSSVEAVVVPTVNELHPQDDAQIGLLAHFLQTVLTIAGEHVVRISADGQALGDIRFDVVLQDQ